MKEGKRLDSHIGTHHKIHGFDLEVFIVNSEQISYYDSLGKRRTAKINLCEWAKGIHGNAPYGTQYGSARLILPDNSRATLPIYI